MGEYHCHSGYFLSRTRHARCTKYMTLSKAKSVRTFGIDGSINGYLTELQKDGRLTTAYLTVAFPGCFKGYHLHKVRESNYVCIRGRVVVILFTKEGRKEIELSSGSFDKLNIPINTPTGIRNDGRDECWLINFPNPPYDPDLHGEQIDFTEQEAETWMKRQRT